jgi:prenyltransferase beta subunit
MKRLALFAVGFLVIAAPLHAGDKAARQTIVYVQKLQADSGGFPPYESKGDAKIVPTLRDTASAVRALKYFGGEVPNKQACMKFVASCYHAKTGGFSNTPGGQPDVFSTAIGLMAVVELNMPLEKYDGASAYMTENAKTFEEIRIAAAGFEAIKEKAPKAGKWVVEVFKLQNKDGTFGQPPGVARDTASCVVTLLRLNYIPPVPGVYLQTYKDGQRQSGGWGKTDNEVSDLETTYRVMRCYRMQGVRPHNADGVRTFVAKCRNADGGYSVTPTQGSSVSGTCFAGIILHWLNE